MLQPYLPLLGATDASLVYGHGAAVAPLPAEELAALSRLASKAGEHVLLSGTELPAEAETRSRRLGLRHRLGLTMGDFEVLFSIRVEAPQHINLEEERALIRYLQWILRSPGRFRHRIVVLVDSRVVVGGTTKGRSGSAQLNVLLRRVAALVLAGGILLHLVFIPSAHNPSDPPSRGGPETWPKALRDGTRYGVESGVRERRRWCRRRSAEAAVLERRLAPLEAALRRRQAALRAASRYMGDDDCSDDMSSTSWD